VLRAAWLALASVSVSVLLALRLELSAVPPLRQEWLLLRAWRARLLLSLERPPRARASRTESGRPARACALASG
jgi:hypothetical protein